MTDSTWKLLLSLLDENQKRFEEMVPSDPMPSALWCRESPHRTLGHLTSCQAAWLPFMRMLKEGKERGNISINPNPLYTKLGFVKWGWDDLLGRFLRDRAEWRQLLDEVDVHAEIQSSRRVWSAQLLTRRLVLHEKNHLEQLAAYRAATTTDNHPPK